jgi:hypothetical protein
MQSLLSRKGDFDEIGQAEDWRTQADMERAVADYISGQYDKRLAESTVRKWVSKFMPKARAELTSAQGRIWCRQFPAFPGCNLLPSAAISPATAQIRA